MKIEIRRRFGTLKITLLSLALLSLFAATPASFAATSTSHTIYASGTISFSTTVVSVNVGPQKTTIFATITDILTGTLKVTYVGVIVFYVYSGGICTYQSGGVDTGTIGASSKTGTALVSAAGTGSCVVGGGVEGTAHFSDGTGGLKGIHGTIGFEGTFASLTTGTGTYQGILYVG